MPSDPRVSVGVAAHVIRDGKLLLLRRAGKHAAGRWSCPGGWLDFGEHPTTGAIRELKEETGLEFEGPVTTIGFLGYVNNVFEVEQIHSVTMHFLVNCVVGEPRNLEPEKCSDIRWFPLDGLPPADEMFPGLPSMILAARVWIAEIP